MKQNKFFIYILSAIFCSSSLFMACDEGIDVDIPVSSCKIEFNQAPDKYELLESDTKLSIPLTITSDKDIQSAFYKIVTKPVNKLVVGTAINLPVSGNKLEKTINIRVTKDLRNIVFGAYDAEGVITYRTISVDSINVVDHNVKVLKDVEMSTDPADNKNFLALYESTPVFGPAVAKTKQNRIDWVLTKTSSGVQPISPHAYGAGTSYYDNSKVALAGFTELTYMFLSAKRSKLIQSEFDAIVTEKNMTDLLKYRIIGPNPDGENYNITTASRRVGDTFNTTTKFDGGFVIGWGSHTHPTVSPAVVSNTAFGLVWLKSVTQKSNGHYVIKFDVKYPSYDEREANNNASIAPYSPYPL